MNLLNRDFDRHLNDALAERIYEVSAFKEFGTEVVLISKRYPELAQRLREILADEIAIYALARKSLLADEVTSHESPPR